MLKRILEQKKIERKGPKRRKTLRINNNDDIIKIGNEVIDEDKKINEQKNAEIVKNMNSENNDSSLNRGSILLNIKDKKKLAELSHSRQSYIISNKLFEHKKISNNFEETDIHNDLEMNNETCNYN